MRTLIHWLRSASRELRRQRRRALTRLLGLTAGLALLLALNAVGAGARRQTLAQVKNMLGTFDTVLVRPGTAATRGMVSLANVPPTLTFADADALATLPAIRQVATLQNAFDVDAHYRDRDHTPAVFGVSANWLDLRGDAVAGGQFFTPAQMQAEARVAVVGKDAQAALFGAENPLGGTLRLGPVPFQVQGQLAPRGAGPGGFSLDDIILIPISTAQHRLFNRDFLTMAVAQLRQPGQSAAALAQIRQLLRQRHHLSALAPDDFTLTDPAAVAAQLTRLTSRLSRIVRGAAWAALLLGGVAVLALLLVAGAERRPEIALRRAAGATRANIVGQFLVEALLLVSVAGGLGLLLGAGAIAAARRWLHLAPDWAGAGWGAAVAATLAWGLLCGVAPAWRAAQVDPARALRS